MMTTNPQKGSLLWPEEVCFEIDYLDQSAMFKGVVFSFILGAGLEFRIGKQLLLLDLRYDWGFDSFALGRDDPKPDSLVLLAGIAF